MSNDNIGTSGARYNSECQDFIPVACHYDNSTILTKNGALIKTIQINGTFSQTIGDNMSHLREIIRNTIRKRSDSSNFAFWVHTVRRKTNLNDDTKYPNIFSSMIHDMWRDKNFWHDKFVNTLYISILHPGVNISISSFASFIRSLSTNNIEKAHDDFLEKASSALHDLAQGMLEDLSSFGASLMSIKNIDGVYYSEQLFLYNRIMNLNEHPVILPVEDLSYALSTNKYAVGNDQIEVVENDKKKFASIISIKEYHELPEEALDKILHLSVEFIATEIFYLVSKAVAIKDMSHYNYILSISKDQRMVNATDVAKMIDIDDSANELCEQQISITLIGDSVSRVKEDTAKASKELAALGIVHVQEDINLEQTFWAQLPGNLHFLRRTSAILIDKVAAFASLHNFPTGNSVNPWGKSITLLRTKDGTPHFVNFHNTNGIGNSLIFGSEESGKTVIMNFLISESMKFNPKILYLSHDSTKSKIFIDALNGQWHDLQYDFVNQDNPNILAFDLSNATSNDKYNLTKNAIKYFQTIDKASPKILVISHMEEMMKDSRFIEILSSSINDLNANNAILIGSVNLNQYAEIYQKNTALDSCIQLGSIVILQGKYEDINIKELTGISQSEEKALRSFSLLSRLFIFKQDNRSVALELSLGGKPGALKILSCSDKDLDLYLEIKSQNPDNWVSELYNAFAHHRG